MKKFNGSKTMRYVFLFLICGLLAALPFTTSAHHNPESDIGKVVFISAWCESPEETIKLLGYMYEKDDKNILKMYYSADPSEGGSSCVHLRLVRSPIKNVPVEIIEFVDEVKYPDGVIGVITKALMGDKTVYTWHHYTPE